MQGPPKHRHDGDSPLPLGMDWSPPPKLWAGRDTIWPHDHRSGWSYCVTIPSWVVLPKSKDSDPIVFYRVLVGIQSPEGVTTTRPILRRFNDFLKLFAAIKKAFPKKGLPPAPPKGLMRLKTRTLLEERRRSLEDWMGKLLSDIDISRCVAVASFLELEAAARSSFHDENRLSSESNPLTDSTASSSHVHSNLHLPKMLGSSSLTSECGSDTAYEISEIGSPSLGRDNHSEGGTEDFSLDDDLTSPIDRFMKYGMSNIDEGLFMGQAILEHLENYPKHKENTRRISNSVENNLINGNTSDASFLAGNMELFPDSDPGNIIHHARKNSAESIGSYMSTQRGSEASTSAKLNSIGDEPVQFSKVVDLSRSMDSVQGTDGQLNDVHLLLPTNQRQKLNGVLLSMQQRLATAKTDMEDLISRLNQEITVKHYLTTKVKDLEVELETTKQKGKDNLEQAMLLERERITQMQWEMEELRRSSMEMELRLKCQEDQSPDTGSIKVSFGREKDLLQELNATKKEMEDLVKRHREVEVKSKADIKVLVKEVKSLRNSQSELKQQLNQSLVEKSKMQELFEQEKISNEHRKAFWSNWLGECKSLLNELQDCEVALKENGGDVVMNIPSSPSSLDLLVTSDAKLDHLLDKAKRLQRDAATSVATSGDVSELDEDLRRLLADLVLGNGELRKQINSLIHNAAKNLSPGIDADEAASNESREQ
ncbi:hypothetical protein LIER_03924 [Lithospermum erythrorhizon]|uniref:PX domain-containing protein n=1 Tax=Lithospermum erythrorhizon TaxID=34254 RepID=A0AAV3NXL8_LITER